MSNPLIKTAEKIEATKKKAKKVVNGWKFRLLAILIGILGALFVLDLAVKNITNFTNTHKIIRQPILTIKIQYPYRIEPGDKQSTKSASLGPKNKQILPSKKTVEQPREDKILDIIAKVHILETNNGKDTSGQHGECLKLGMQNHIGYGSKCFKTEDEEVTTAYHWFSNCLSDKSTEICLCYWNTGIMGLVGCDYYKKFLTL